MQQWRMYSDPLCKYRKRQYHIVRILYCKCGGILFDSLIYNASGTTGGKIATVLQPGAMHLSLFLYKVNV